MAGFLIGAICGAAELLLLGRLVRAVSTRDTVGMMVFFSLKILTLILSFVPVVIFFRESLYLFGAGIAAVLIFGSVTHILWARHKNSKGDAEQ